MKVDDLSPAQVKEALMITQLGIVFANFQDTSAPLLQAAHSDTQSFVILRHADGGGWDGWRLTDAPKEARREHYRAMIKRFSVEEGATLMTPDGRELDKENTDGQLTGATRPQS